MTKRQSTDEKIREVRQEFIDATLGELDAMAKNLESPIERLFLWTLCLSLPRAEPLGYMPANLPGTKKATVPGGAFAFPPGAHRVGFGPCSGCWFHLWSQVPVRPLEVEYRLDFVFEIRRFDHQVFVDVELDGHDFHERTREQAERDKKRDRDVQALGYYIARFTGSEVYRDPDRVASEVFGFAKRLLRSQEARSADRETGDA